MIREKLIDKGIGDNKKFSWRGFGAFAICFTLLIVVW
jgi:hypothetical protein